MRFASVMLLCFVGIATGAAAQTRDQFQILDRRDLAVAGQEAIVAIDRLAPSAETGWHAHPGDMVAYVTEGEITFEQEGREPLVVRRGESFIIPAGVGHNSRNATGASAEMFVTFITTKDRPLSEPRRPGGGRR